MSDTGGDAPREEFGFDFNEAAFRAQAERAASVFATAFLDVMEGVTKQTKKLFEEAFNVGPDVRQASKRAGAQAAGGLNEGFTDNLNLGAGLEDQLAGLRKAAAAQAKTLTGLGLDKDLLGGVDAQLRVAAKAMEEFRQAQVAGLDPENLRVFARRVEATVESVKGSLREVEPLFRNLVSQRQAASSANTAQMQQETTLQNALIRGQTQREVQAAQSASRARIEIARFTFRQIAFIERQLANTVRGSIAIIGNITGGVAAGVGRITSLFRRSDRELNEGLNGALNARERSLGRSFDRQAAIVNRGMAQQSATIQRFERQSSRGLAGLATGRGSLGSLVGGGVALGAGFKLAQSLREGFKEAVNLNEAMNAVRQVFGSASDEVVKFSETSVETLFQTQSQALKAAVSFGVFGKAAGLAGSELAGFTTELTLLGTDLASFYNTTVPEAVTALSAALRGESEPIRRFGVLLNEQILQQRAVTEGIIDTVRVLQPGERVLAAYAEIMARTAFVQGDAARTADDFANSSRRAGAAATTTFAAIAKFAVPVAEILLKGIIPSLETLTKFIEGNVSPALLTLRQGLIGAAGGLAALLAVRGVIEILQFAAIALRAIITPVGLVVTAFAALGAAFAIIRERNPAVIVLLERLRDTLGSGIAAGLERVASFASRVAEVVQTRVIPVFIGLAAIIASRVVPLLERVGEIVTGTVLPALRDVGDLILGAFDTAAPAIEAVVRQLIRFGGAVRSAFSGNFSGLLAIVSDIGAGVAAGVSGLGDLLTETVLPQLERFARFLQGFFDGIDWEGLGLGALRIVETIGYVLGRIASSPQFITALAAVAAAAAIVAITFTKGVLEGIRDNLPGLGELIKDAFFAISLEQFLTVAALAGLIASLVGTFTTIGATAGGSFIRGFGQAIARFPGQARGGIAGLFGPAATEQAARAGRIQAEAYQKAFNNANRDLRALGGAAVAPRQNTPIGAADVRRAQVEVNKLSESLGVARTRSLLFRDSFRTAFNATVLRDVQGLGQAVGQAFRRTDFRQLGQNAGVAVLGSFGAVMAGKDGFSKGGVAGILASAIGAGIATGSPFVAAAVAGAGLIAASIGEIGRAAREVTALIKELATEFQDLGNTERILALQKKNLDAVLAAGEGVVAVAKELPDSFGTDFARQAVNGSVTAQDAFRSLAQGIGLDAAEVDGYLASFGTNLGNIKTAGNIASQEADFTDETRALFDFNAQLEKAGLTAEGFYGLLDILTSTSAGASGAIKALSDTSSLAADNIAGAALGTADLNAQARNAIAGVDGLTEAQREYNRITSENTTRSLFESVQQEVAAAGGSVVNLFDLVVAAALKAGAEIDLGFLDRLINGTDELVTATDRYFARLAALNENQVQTNLPFDPQAIKDYTDAALELEGQFNDLVSSTGFVEKALDSLNQQRADRINAEIDGLETRLKGAEDAADRAREALTAFITGKYQNTPQALVDDFIGSLSGVAESLAGASLVSGETGAAALRSIFGDIDGEIADIIQAGFEAGLNAQQIQALFDPVLGAIGETVNPLTAIYNPDRVIVPPEIAARIAAQLQAGVDTNEIGIGMQAIFDADAQVNAIQKQLDAKRAELDLDVAFSPEQVEAALVAAGLDTHTVKLIADPSQISLLQGDGLTGDVAAFLNAAGLIAAGLTILGEAPTNPNGDTAATLAPAITQFIVTNGSPEETATAAGNGVAEASAAAGGGYPSKNVIYRPIFGGQIPV